MYMWVIKVIDYKLLLAKHEQQLWVSVLIFLILHYSALL